LGFAAPVVFRGVPDRLLDLFRWTLERYARRLPWRRLRIWVPSCVVAPLAPLWLLRDAWPVAGGWFEPIAILALIPNAAGILMAAAVFGRDTLAVPFAAAAVSWVSWWLLLHWLEYIAFSREPVGLGLAPASLKTPAASTDPP
jgi:hypothetical protein